MSVCRKQKRPRQIQFNQLHFHQRRCGGETSQAEKSLGWEVCPELMSGFLVHRGICKNRRERSRSKRLQGPDASFEQKAEHLSAREYWFCFCFDLIIF